MRAIAAILIIALFLDGTIVLIQRHKTSGQRQAEISADLPFVPTPVPVPTPPYPMPEPWIDSVIS